MPSRSKHVIVLEDCGEDFTAVEEVSSGWSEPVQQTRFTRLQAALETHDESFETPVQFLLDLSVPGGRGMDLLRAIKNHSRPRMIPTVIL